MTNTEIAKIPVETNFNFKLEEITQRLETQKAFLFSDPTKVSNAQLAFCAEYCHRMRLDPIQRQIYFLQEGSKITFMTSIDGLVALASRTGKFRGFTTVEYLDANKQWLDYWIEETPPLAARVGVYRSDFELPLFHTVSWKEFGKEKYEAVGKYDNRQYFKYPIWRDRPSHMLGKVAKSGALRSTFELGQLYTEDEIDFEQDKGFVAETPARTKYVRGDATKAIIAPPKFNAPTQQPVEAPPPPPDPSAQKLKELNIKARGLLASFPAEFPIKKEYFKSQANEVRKDADGLENVVAEIEAWLANPDKEPEANGETDDKPDETPSAPVVDLDNVKTWKAKIKDCKTVDALNTVWNAACAALDATEMTFLTTPAAMQAKALGAEYVEKTNTYVIQPKP